MAVYPRRRLFTVGEYYEMARAGILSEDDRVELINGEIIEMSPIGNRHAADVTRTQKVIEHRVGDRFIIRGQNPVRLSDESEPEPDLAIVRYRPDFYASGHPTPDDVLLIIEIADTTLAFDRKVKIPLYARSGVPETWLASIERRTITAYRDPGPDGYRSARTARRGERLTPALVPDLELRVEDILG